MQERSVACGRPRSVGHGMMQTQYLDVAPELAAQGLSTAVVVGTGIHNASISPELIAYRRKKAAEIAAFWRGRTEAESPELAAYTALHRRFGVTDQVASPQKLIAFIRRNRDVTGTGAVTDCYNLVSARTLVSIGAHDLDRLALPVSLRICGETERFTPLDGSAARTCAGEYGYVDAENRIVCRLDVLQGRETAVDEHSTRVVFFLQGNPAIAGAELLRAAWYLAELLETFCRARAELVAFSAAKPGAVEGRSC